jgi:hypothetical protein
LKGDVKMDQMIRKALIASVAPGSEAGSASFEVFLWTSIINGILNPASNKSN